MRAYPPSLPTFAPLTRSSSFAAAAQPASPSPPPIPAVPAAPAARDSASPVAIRPQKRRASSPPAASGSGSLDAENQDLRAKLARLEARMALLDGQQVEREVEGDNDGGGDAKPRAVESERIGKDRRENGRVVIDLLDEDSD